MYHDRRAPVKCESKIAGTSCSKNEKENPRESTKLITELHRRTVWCSHQKPEEDARNAVGTTQSRQKQQKK